MSEAKEFEDIDDSSIVGTKTSADGGSGITATIFTAPSDKAVRIKKLLTRVKDAGSASLVHLKVAGQRLMTWKVDAGDPNHYTNASSTITYATSKNRKIWGDGSFPEWNHAYEDLKDLVLQAGESIAYDGNFASNFNATVEFALTTYEEQ